MEYVAGKGDNKYTQTFNRKISRKLDAKPRHRWKDNIKNDI